MKRYNSRVEHSSKVSADKNYTTTASSGGGYKGSNHRQSPRYFNPPTYLSPYERSVWFLKSFNGMAVHRRENDTNDILIRRFKKMVDYAGTLSEIKKREFYLTPSQRKKDKKKKALKRWRKRQKEDDKAELTEEALYPDKFRR